MQVTGKEESAVPTGWAQPKLMTRRSPCKSCPFRADIDFHLSLEKVRSIVGALQGDDVFLCHNTTGVADQPSALAKACIGSAIFLEHIRAGGLRANIAFRLRESWLEGFDRDELNINSPVFTSVAEFVKAKTLSLNLIADRS